MSFLNEIVFNEKDKNKEINYSLKNLLINFNKDEVQAMIYQSNKNGKKIEEMKEFILEKISLTLPQDTSINIRINGFRQKYPEYFEKIINFYEKGEHSNFVLFLEKMDNYKNAVYTFSNNLENIKDIKNIY